MALSPQLRRTREPRYRLLAGLVALGFGLVVLALLRLQVVEHARYRDLAKENRVRLEVLRAPRGAIYDRHGNLLADSGPSFTIVFQPFPAESAHRTRQVQGPEWLARVARVLELDTLEVRRRVREANRNGQTAVLRRAAPFAVLAGVEELRERLPGIDVQIEPLRRYAHGTLGSHLLGYANEVNDRDLREREGQGYHAGDLIGRSGVERTYEDVLRGVDGAEFVVVNAMGQRVAQISEGPPRLPVRGNDIVLTVDLAIQRALEEAMADVDRGAAVALDPRDGGVLGLVSRPAFDPNEFSRGISVRRWREITSGGSNPLLNRVVQGVYPPGSTFKIVTMLAALRAGLVQPETHLAPCPGAYYYGGRRFGCWKRTGHGSLDFIGALQHSCDVYFYQIGPRLGLDRLEAAAREFGLGERTGVDLPQEARGLVPSTAYYDRRWGAGRWRSGVMLNLAIGQGELLTTPIQLALMAAESGNGGRPLTPHLVREVRGRPDRRPPRPSATTIPADERTWAAVREALVRVVSEGTGTAVRIPGVVAAGKTGTAQNPHGDDHALFVCYAPARDPVIAMAFVIENSGHGGSVAAPKAAHVLRRMFLPDSLQTDYVPPPPPAARDTAETERAD